MDDADRQFRRPEGQLRVPGWFLLIRAVNQLLHALHHGGDERVCRAIVGGLAQGGSKAHKGTAGSHRPAGTGHSTPKSSLSAIAFFRVRGRKGISDVQDDSRQGDASSVRPEA
jgi:hypothetical protein